MTDFPKIIAVCGKGGVGKTSISALLTILLSEVKTRKVLAIDADPAVGLSLPLGIEVKKTVDHIRNDLIRSIESGEKSGKEALLNRLDYELFEALAEKDNLAFLAIGRPEGDGCYCQVNSLLREIIQNVAGKFDFVVIDGEAGIEQINRRVMEMVTHLFLVTDSSIKGQNVAAIIEKVARNKIRFQKAGVFYNRMQDEEEVKQLLRRNELPVIGWMPENQEIRKFDREGKNFFSFQDSNIMIPLKQAVQGFIHE
ncbi:MAG: cobyrinic acid a,c-diamide synthase [Deltaproteobacteria bacterium]|nr:MAG: cobyrinic acid a,c-diamide synthase [Deltaproteobacteria bacterium]